ncbi:aldehyde dehydrogenase (plasmid) [Rhodococcus erythropolis]|uniref:aldehyde dehydrogenase n=1 Tax=Rhodococcus erythropolis TaxID=1833 RepID=UPI00061B6541|nr:aldehyde dehydrogenase [Rhodococcus erythropolis]AKE01113.1 aldehyde dehydrogenase [Rhodococcus erythropolis]
MNAKTFEPAAELSEDVRTRFLIDGKWQVPLGLERFDLVSPMTETVTLNVPLGSHADMDVAITSARRAFDETDWAYLAPSQRAQYLNRVADEIEARIELFKRVWIGQVGAPAWFVNAISGAAVGHFRFYAGLSETYPFEEQRIAAAGSVTVLREPVGVAALIAPWNAPLVLLTQKLAAALMAGCTTVIKPSPETPLDALLLAECVVAAGIPAGVVNVVPAGREVGSRLVSDSRIDKVSFTGSTDAGRQIAKVCGERLARVGLELGGKSASILCDDADLDDWMRTLAPFTMPFSGQICFAQTRVLVPENRHDEVVDAFVAGVEKFQVGDPWQPDTVVGPVSLARQRDRVLNYLDVGRAEGARVATGGGRALGFDRGYFISPTIFDNVTNDMRIAREEIFGPVVSVIKYRNDDEAVAIANDSEFGLSGSVFSADAERAARIARRVRTGQISVNSFNLDVIAPFGGYKNSGLGRESGVEGLGGFQETKAIFSPT